MVDSNHQLKMVLNNEVNAVAQDVRNITRILSDLSGIEIHPHLIEKHRGVQTISNDLDPTPLEVLQDSDDMTDIYLYGIQSNQLVETERMIR